MDDIDSDTVLSLALVFAFEKKKKKRKPPRIWMKNWLQRRQEFTHERLLRELRVNEPDDFKNFLRMDGTTYDELLAMVTPIIQKEDTVMRDAIPASQRLSITLRYLATGNTFEDLKFTSAMSPQSIGKIVLETCEAIVSCLKNYIRLPATEQEWVEVALDFQWRWNFPHCLGAIDGKHISIRKPPHSGSFYFNYKKFFSIVLLAVVNANYEFPMVDVGVNGRVSNGGVISHTDFGQMLSSGTLNIPQPAPIPMGPRSLYPYAFVGDDAFAMTENLLKPYSPSAAGSLDMQQRIFNYRLSRARRIVENAFGILVSRFGALQRCIQVSPEKASMVTLACCYLHNFLRRKAASYITRESVDWEDKDGNVQDGSWRKENRPIHDLQANTSRNATNRAKLARDMYRDFFYSDGAIPWQWNKCS